MSTRPLVILFIVLVFCFCSTICAASSLTPWNSITNDASESLSLDLHLDEYAEVEFSVTAGSSYRWTWTMNDEVVKKNDGTNSNLEYVVDDYGSSVVTVQGTSETETLQASWNLTVWLIVEEENDIRELEGLADYVLRLSKRPERIVSMAPSCTEILFAVGAGDQVVGVTEYCDYPPEMVEKKNRGEIAIIGGYSTPSFEKIVALQPDLVVGAYGNPDDVFYWLVDENVHPGVTYPVYAQNPGDLEEIFEQLRVVGALTGHRAEADSLEYELRDRVATVTVETASLNEVERPRVFYNIGDFFTAGDNTFVNEIITLAGGINIAAGSSGYFVMNLEEFIDRNPQVIICDSGMGSISLAYEQILADERLQIVDAVKNGWVYVIDADSMDRPGPRIVDALQLVYADYSDFFAATRPIPTSTPSDSSSAAAGGSSTKAATIPAAPSTSTASPPMTQATRIVPMLKPGEEVAMIFEESCISLLALRADTTVSDITVAVNSVEWYSDIPDPPGIAYAYLSITVDSEEAAQLTGKVEFNVAKSWLADHDIDGAAVTLNRYHEHEGWIALSTDKIGEDNATVYFEAETLAFSVFVITGAVTIAETPAPASVVAPTATPVLTPTPTLATTSAPASQSDISGFSGAGTFAGLLAIAYLLSLRMNKEHRGRRR